MRHDKEAMYEESVSEPEDVRMARLHSLLTKTKTPLLPVQNKNPRRIPNLRSQTEDVYGKQVTSRKPWVLDTPFRTARPIKDTTISTSDLPVGQREETPSPAPQFIKPPSSLPPSEWRTAALLHHHHHQTSLLATPPPPPPKPHPTFPLLSLPPELRSTIYHHLLVSSDRLLPTWRGPQRATRQQTKMHIAILLTCRLVHAEATQVLYGENVFDFGELCNRPDNFSGRFLGRIGRRNAGLIRVVVAEYGAAAEEVWGEMERRKRVAEEEKAKAKAEAGEEDDGGEAEAEIDADADAPPIREVKAGAHLTVSYVRAFLGKCGIELKSLRVLAISLAPYGCDQATGELLRLQDEAVRSNVGVRVKWLEGRNEAGWLARVAEGICEREAGFARARYWEDVDGWIGGEFSPPSSGREWLVYRGVRGKEDGLVGEGMRKGKGKGKVGVGEGVEGGDDGALGEEKEGADGGKEPDVE